MTKPSKNISIFRPYVTQKACDRAAQVLASGWIGQGPVVKEFERMFEQKLQVSYAVAVNSCTSALHLALSCVGVSAGDEVITSAQTFMATSHVILQNSARPIFGDVQYLTGNLDPGDIERRITERTKAIIPVHWGGYPCDMDEIHSVAKRYQLSVIEDAAHAIGATYHGQPIGSLSRFTCFSFQAVKHLTTGDGGMLTAHNLADYKKAMRCRWFGIDRDRRRPSVLGEPQWDVSEVGFKYHMNDIAAAIGVEHLADIDIILDQRRRFARIYREGIGTVSGITLFEAQPDRESAFWVFDIHVENRDEFIRMLKSKGVEASVVHQRIDRNSVFGGLRHDLPMLEKFNKSHVALPIHNGLLEQDIHYIVKCVREGW